jgi:hypothetical protein
MDLARRGRIVVVDDLSVRRFHPENRLDLCAHSGLDCYNY